MPPPPRTETEDFFWGATLALLRGRAVVTKGEVRYDYHDRDYGQCGARPTRGSRAGVSLDLQLLLADRDPVPDDPRQLRLAVATMLAERVGMRLAPLPEPQRPSVDPDAARPPADRPIEPPRADEDPTSIRFSLLELE